MKMKSGKGEDGNGRQAGGAWRLLHVDVALPPCLLPVHILILFVRCVFVIVIIVVVVDGILVIHRFGLHRMVCKHRVGLQGLVSAYHFSALRTVHKAKEGRTYHDGLAGICEPAEILLHTLCQGTVVFAERVGAGTSFGNVDGLVLRCAARSSTSRVALALRQRHARTEIVVPAWRGLVVVVVPWLNTRIGQ